MSNPFAGWTPEMVEAFNSRTKQSTTKGGEVKCDATAVKPILDTQAPSSLVQSTVIRTSNSGERASEHTRQITIDVEPCPAPRMTRQDKWRGRVARGKTLARRPIVQRYFDYRALLQTAAGDLPIVPDELNAVFHFAMPESWSKKRRQEMNGQPHRQRPDGDNCTKAIQDALFLEDGGVWRGAFEKRWAIHGRVELTMIWR